MYQHAYHITHRIEPDTHDPQDSPQRVSCFFPASRGVVEFVAHDGSTVLLAATGHIRDFVAQRMSGDATHSPSADLAPVTGRIVAYPTGSALESDLLVLERARVADPALHDRIVEQNRRALLVLDAASGTWRVAETSTLKTSGEETVIGPILSARAATALGECLDDVFELCRYPRQLALAPRGTACAYKQMGRCPAACDGSEPMSAYMERFAQATAAASAGTLAWRRQIRGEIARASAELDFEQAARIKHRLDCVDRLPLEALDRARSMHDFACVCVTPAWRAGWAMVWVLGEAGLVPIIAIEGGAPDAIGALIRTHAEPVGSEPEQLERFALVARHWFTKPARARRRRVTILDLRNDDWERTLADAIAQAQAPSDPDLDDEEHTHISGE